MSSPVPSFDDLLNEALVDEAARSGESVELFIARATAARIAVEMARRGDPRLDDILRRVRVMDLDLPRGEPDVAAGSVIADPERIRALYDTGLLDSRRGSALDRVVQMAVAALAVPSSAVSLVDRDKVYLPSAIGMPGELATARQVPLAQSISLPIVSSGAPVILDDARLYPELRDHPMVLDGYVVAFAGMPITDAQGHTIGALSVWDSTPRRWSDGHIQILQDFTAIVCRQIFPGS